MGQDLRNGVEESEDEGICDCRNTCDIQVTVAECIPETCTKLLARVAFVLEKCPAAICDKDIKLQAGTLRSPNSQHLSEPRCWAMCP